MKGTNGDSIVLSVPDVLGAKYTNVADTIDERYYDIDIIYVYNSSSAPGVVVSQSPAPHERVEINPFEEQCVITISVSAEVRELTLIDVISLSPEEASIALRREGYLVNFLSIYSDTVAKGLVCGTLPAAGEKVLAGSEITIYVSMGSEVIDIKVPSFVGLNETEAAAKLIAVLKEAGTNVVEEVFYVKSAGFLNLNGKVTAEEVADFLAWTDNVIETYVK